MSPTWMRPAVAAALMAVTVTGCSGKADSGSDDTVGSQPTTSTQSAGQPPAADLTDLSANAIFAKAKSVGMAARSVRVRGSAKDKAGDRVDFDVRMTKTGGQGTFVVSGAKLGSRVIGKTAYLQLSEPMLRRMAKQDKLSTDETSAVVTMLKNKWIKLSQQSAGDFDLVLTMTAHDKFFPAVFAPSAKLRKTPQKEVDGIASIGLSDGEGTLWVDARTGRPVRLDGGSDGKESYRFSDYDTLKPPAVPRAGETVDGAPLGF